MKEKITATEQKPTRGAFVACGKVTGGGIWKAGGFECHGGLRVYRAVYNGNLERFANDCQCLIAWRNGKGQKDLVGVSASPAVTHFKDCPEADLFRRPK